MTLFGSIKFVCTAVATMAIACSSQTASPTAPSRLDSIAGPSRLDSTVETPSATFGVTPGTEGLIVANASPSVVNFEIKFMTDMIDHHHMAVMMAEICLQKAVHGELRSLCNTIRTTQMAEIDQMQAWLLDWYGISHEPVMKPGDQQMMERLASLSEAEFEIAFMEMMIKHHEKAIKEGRHCLDKASHAELRSLCQNIIATQSAEIAHMQTWLCQWYGRCR